MTESSDTVDAKTFTQEDVERALLARKGLIERDIGLECSIMGVNPDDLLSDGSRTYHDALRAGTEAVYPHSVLRWSPLEPMSYRSFGPPKSTLPYFNLRVMYLAIQKGLETVTMKEFTDLHREVVEEIGENMVIAMMREGGDATVEDARRMLGFYTGRRPIE